ncbi:MAG: class IV adenylate cyclase [Calditrichaceae bacterium]
MSLNIEIKARFNDPELFKTKIAELQTTYAGRDHQTDTFFHVPKGRLKLRESSLYGNILIPYIRNDQAGPKKSDYTLIKIDDSQKTKDLLTHILGIRVVVEKEREIFLFENVRIHLDHVKFLGTFIEFEAVVEDDSEIDKNHQKIQDLLSHFNIQKDDLIPKAYADLLHTK